MLGKEDLNKLVDYKHEGVDLSSVFMQSMIDEINRNTPVGLIAPYSGSIAPDGYLLCDGNEVSREQYKALFDIIGITYGAGDGSTTFTLPNLLGKTVLGSASDYPLGSNGGEESHILSPDELPSHTHVQTAHTHAVTGTLTANGDHIHLATEKSAGTHTHTVTGTAAKAGSHNHPTERSTITGIYDTIPKGGARTNPTQGEVYAAGDHTHTVSGTASSAGDHTHTIIIESNGAHTHELTAAINSVTAVNGNTGKDYAHNNMMPYVALNYIIRY